MSEANRASFPSQTDRRNSRTLTAEKIAYWYLRLNGFLLLDNYLVHGDRRGQTRTDIDLLGVRFRYRREHLNDPMQDDDWIEKARRNILVFCEVKTGAQDLNASWALRNRNMMESFLGLIGIVPPEYAPGVVEDLYDHGRSERVDGLLITTLLINHDLDCIVPYRWKEAQRISISHALEFIHHRFSLYRNLKSDNRQWHDSGQLLWRLFNGNWRSQDQFVESILREIGARLPAQRLQ